MHRDCLVKFALVDRWNGRSPDYAISLLRGLPDNASGGGKDILKVMRQDVVSLAFCVCGSCNARFADVRFAAQDCPGCVISRCGTQCTWN
jgi:hypothetical protein